MAVVARHGYLHNLFENLEKTENPNQTTAPNPHMKYLRPKLQRVVWIIPINEGGTDCEAVCKWVTGALEAPDKAHSSDFKACP